MKKLKAKLASILIGLIIVSISAACTSSDTADDTIIYLDYDENSVAQIYTLTIGAESPNQLTTSATDVMEYTLSADGKQIAYVVKEGNGGNSIWVMNTNGSKVEKVRNCPTSTCNRLEWHPDGQRLLYEKRPFSAQTRPTIWWVDVNNGETVTVLSNPNEVSGGTAVSPDGKWLSYVSPPNETIEFVHFATGERFSVPSVLGTPAVWHPDSQQAITRDLNLITYHTAEGTDHTEHEHDFAESVHLFNSSIEYQERQILDETGNVDDGNATWSPDGEQIAFGRKIARTNTGRQLWIMQADGSEAQALTDNLQIQHGPPQWSENGRLLLFQKANLSDPEPQPSIWQYDLANKQMEQLTTSGWFPQWLP